MDYNARMYDPALGRFVQADTIVSTLGSQGYNRYAYVGNSPVNFTDPSGNVRIDGECGFQSQDRGTSPTLTGTETTSYWASDTITVIPTIKNSGKGTGEKDKGNSKLPIDPISNINSTRNSANDHANETCMEKENSRAIFFESLEAIDATAWSALLLVVSFSALPGSLIVLEVALPFSYYAAYLTD